MEAEIQKELTERVRKTVSTVVCTKVTVLRKTATEYTGLAEFSDRSNCTIRIDVDGLRYIWRVEP